MRAFHVLILTWKFKSEEKVDEEESGGRRLCKIFMTDIAFFLMKTEMKLKTVVVLRGRSKNFEKLEIFENLSDAEE